MKTFICDQCGLIYSSILLTWSTTDNDFCPCCGAYTECEEDDEVEDQP